jgi:hypothetical protein
MYFSPKSSVPDSLEEFVPSVRKGSMLKCGIAGSKRKEYIGSGSRERGVSDCKTAQTARDGIFVIRRCGEGTHMELKSNTNLYMYLVLDKKCGSSKRGVSTAALDAAFPPPRWTPRYLFVHQ